jgi:dTDP-glucose pyrophosphorylase
LHILVLAAGIPAFQVGGESYPLYLTEVDGLLLLNKVVNQCIGIKQSRFTFAFNREEIQQFHLRDICKLIDDSAHVVAIEGMSRGAACTALYCAIDFEASASLLVINANQLVDVNLKSEIEGFESSGVDAAVFVFNSAHPRYSYVKVSPEGLVLEAAEKRPISHFANTGIFWFKRSGDFVQALQQMIIKGACVDDKFYVAPALNELVLAGKKIAVKEITRSAYHPIKNEKQLSDFEINLAEQVHGII